MVPNRYAYIAWCMSPRCDGFPTHSCLRLLPLRPSTCYISRTSQGFCIVQGYVASSMYRSDGTARYDRAQSWCEASEYVDCYKQLGGLSDMSLRPVPCSSNARTQFADSIFSTSSMQLLTALAPLLTTVVAFRYSRVVETELTRLSIDGGIPHCIDLVVRGDVRTNIMKPTQTLEQ